MKLKSTDKFVGYAGLKWLRLCLSGSAILGTVVFVAPAAQAAQLTYTERVITQRSSPSSVHSVDLDADGDMDVLSTTINDNKIAWYENLGGTPTQFAPQTVISTEAAGARSVTTADLDGDGDLDVLSASYDDNKIAWYENLGGIPSTFAAQAIISTAAGGAESVTTADIDGDGDLDVLSASSIDSKIAWYENLGGSPITFAAQATISTAASGAASVTIADIDGDGDLDVLSASMWDNTIAWYENLGGTPITFAAQVVISTAIDGAMSVAAADMDGDGDVDVLSASRWDGKIAWYENLRDQPLTAPVTFAAQSLISTVAFDARSVTSADIDDDGDLDVVAGFDWGNQIAWYENSGTLSPTFTLQSSSSPFTYSSWGATAADVDGDFDLDIVTVSNRNERVAWYENQGGTPNTFAAEAVISTTTEADQARSVATADLDGDGDVDVLSASYGDNKIAWYENVGGSPTTFAPQAILTTAASGAHAVTTADLDGDGDMDVLSISENDYKIAWYENLGGSPTPFGSQRIISQKSEGSDSITTADLDGDGDQDVLTASHRNFETAWYENLGGTPPSFTSKVRIFGAVNGARSIATADIDGDGDIDVLSASSLDDKIAWYENLRDDPVTGPVTFAVQVIISTSADEAESVAAADLDGDGDMDVLSASNRDDKIAWYENLRDEPISAPVTFAAQAVISTRANGARSVTTADLDGDGDLDVLSASSWDNEIATYENLGGSPLIFASQQIVSTGASGARSVVTADINGDGLIDILSASERDDKIAWYEAQIGCSIAPCQNGGTCTDLYPGYSCDCSGTGYIGAECTDIDECLTNNGDCGDATYTLCTNHDTAPQVCSDIDECGTNNGDCGAAVFYACTNNVGAAPACNDIDECAAQSDDCHADATCANTGGAFTCTCNTGYTGSGTVCTDFDECATNNGNCGAPAAYSCTNNAGAEATCLDIDECAAQSDDCHADAACTNTDGAFTCACNSGYSGSGTSCTDVDECATNNGDCGAAASYACTNNIGTDPTCVDIDECAVQSDDCDADATCTNTDGGFTCACDSGYTGAGTVCADVDECTAQSDDCHSDATCTNTDGGFTCACSSGYTGSGTSCIDVDECTALTDDCSTSATCANTAGAYTCTCNAGTIGDGVTCTSTAVCDAPGAVDTDSDGLCDAADLCPNDAGKTVAGVCGCGVAEDLTDSDGDSVADCVDADDDGDGVDDVADNCPALSNPDQADLDADGIGSACDSEEVVDDGAGDSRPIATAEGCACDAASSSPLGSTAWMLLAAMGLLGRRRRGAQQRRTAI